MELPTTGYCFSCKEHVELIYPPNPTFEFSANGRCFTRATCAKPKKDGSAANIVVYVKSEFCKGIKPKSPPRGSPKKKTTKTEKTAKTEKPAPRTRTRKVTSPRKSPSINGQKIPKECLKWLKNASAIQSSPSSPRQRSPSRSPKIPPAPKTKTPSPMKQRSPSRSPKIPPAAKAKTPSPVKQRSPSGSPKIPAAAKAKTPSPVRQRSSSGSPKIPAAAKAKTPSPVRQQTPSPPMLVRRVAVTTSPKRIVPAAQRGLMRPKLPIAPPKSTTVVRKPSRSPSPSRSNKRASSGSSSSSESEESESESEEEM